MAHVCDTRMSDNRKSLNDTGDSGLPAPGARGAPDEWQRALRGPELQPPALLGALLEPRSRCGSGNRGRGVLCATFEAVPQRLPGLTGKCPGTKVVHFSEGVGVPSPRVAIHGWGRAGLRAAEPCPSGVRGRRDFCGAPRSGRAETAQDGLGGAEGLLRPCLQGRGGLAPAEPRDCGGCVRCPRQQERPRKCGLA